MHIPGITNVNERYTESKLGVSICCLLSHHKSISWEEYKVLRVGYSTCKILQNCCLQFVVTVLMLTVFKLHFIPNNLIIQQRKTKAPIANRVNIASGAQATVHRNHQATSANASTTGKKTGPLMIKALRGLKTFRKWFLPYNTSLVQFILFPL